MGANTHEGEKTKETGLASMRLVSQWSNEKKFVDAWKKVSDEKKVFLKRIAKRILNHFHRERMLFSQNKEKRDTIFINIGLITI